MPIRGSKTPGGVWGPPQRGTIGTTIDTSSDGPFLEETGREPCEATHAVATCEAGERAVRRSRRSNDVTRLAQRHVAPFLAGILAAGFLVAAVDAAGVMPLSGILAQAPGDPAGAGGSPANPTPLSELDLDELVLEPSRFDFESVRVDLDFVGDFQGLYEWAPEPVTPANVAVDLELVVTDPVDPDGDGPIVTAEHAAASYLLSDDCNALSALPIRRQAKLRVLARILRPDEATIAALQRQAATPPAEDSAPVATALAVETDPTGAAHVEPLESVVEVATVTVSETDFDLIRARPVNLLNDLVADDPSLAPHAPPGSTGDVFGTPAFYEAAWTSCLIASAEEGTVPVPQTLNGLEVWSLIQDHPEERSVDAGTPDIDTVTWLEDGLEFRVESTFLNVDDDISVNPLFDLDTRTWLQHFADSVEPALDLGGRLVARNADALDLLRTEAFAEPAGSEFGDVISGAEDAVPSTIRNLETPPLQDLLAAGTTGATPAPPAAAAPPGTDAGGAADHILGVMARPVLPAGAVLTNVRNRLSDPPNGFGISPTGVVQMVVWDPEYLNSDAFRAGWAEGMKESFALAVTLDELPFVSGEGAELASNLASLDVVDLVFSESEGTFRVDYLTPCYSVTVSRLDSEGILSFTQALVSAQKAARDAVFGRISPPLVTSPGPAPDLGVLSPSLEDLDRDYVLAALLGNAEEIEEREEAARAQRAKDDARRAALCSASNLNEFLSGFVVPDADLNGVSDALPENDVAAGAAVEGVTAPAG